MAYSMCEGPCIPDPICIVKNIKNLGICFTQ